MEPRLKQCINSVPVHRQVFCLTVVKTFCQRKITKYRDIRVSRCFEWHQDFPIRCLSISVVRASVSAGHIDRRFHLSSRSASIISWRSYLVQQIYSLPVSLQDAALLGRRCFLSIHSSLWQLSESVAINHRIELVACGNNVLIPILSHSHDFISIPTPVDNQDNV